MEKENEKISLLRHRFGRTIEIWTAYNVFLKQQVFVGEEYICRNSLILEQTTHTLLVTYYSYLHSLFDPSGTDFIKNTESVVSILPERTKQVRVDIITHWELIKGPLNRIRNNIGFHGSYALKRQVNGYAAFAESKLHPCSPDYLLHLLRVFFRDLASVFSVTENYALNLEPQTTEEVYKLAKDLKHIIDTLSVKEFCDNIKSLLQMNKDEK